MAFNKNDKYTEFVNVYDTFVDTSYQRRCHRSVVKIANNWDWRKVGLPKLSKRPDGSYAIIDGQHRLEAFKVVLSHMKSVSDTDKLIECEVLTGLTPQEEALLFAFQGENRVNVTSMEEFTAAVFNGDKTNLYVRLNNACLRYHIPVVQVDSSKVGVRCIRSLRDYIVTYGDVFVDYYLYVIKKSGWAHKFDAFSLLFVGVFAQLFITGTDKDKLALYLQEYSPDRLLFDVQKSKGKQKLSKSDVSSYISVNL